MDEHLRSENRSTLATISAFISFPYIWLGLFLLLSIMYGGNFFGRELGGGVVAGLLCLGLLNPFVPGLLSNFIARPLFLNLLGREIISTAGCLTGLVGFTLTGVAVLYFIARDLTVAMIIFLIAPVIGGAFAIAVSAFERGGFTSKKSGGRISVSRIQKPPSSRRLPPYKGDRPQLSNRKTPSRLPPPRRSSRRSSTKRHVPPPPRRSE